MQLSAKKFHKHIVIEDICPNSSFYSRSCCICTLYGFVTKEFYDLHRVDELKNFTANIFLKLVSKPYLDLHIELVSHVLGVMHQKERLSV